MFENHTSEPFGIGILDKSTLEILKKHQEKVAIIDFCDSEKGDSYTKEGLKIHVLTYNYMFIIYIFVTNDIPHKDHFLSEYEMVEDIKDILFRCYEVQKFYLTGIEEGFIFGSSEEEIEMIMEDMIQKNKYKLEVLDSGLYEYQFIPIFNKKLLNLIVLHKWQEKPPGLL